MVARRIAIVPFLLLLCAGDAATQKAAPAAAGDVSYRLSFPAPEHRWMQVEVRFANVPAGPLQIRMSRTSPGRYALHEFAKNVFDVQVKDGEGRPLAVSRPSLHQWDAAGHDGTVVVTYRIFGDRIDGTYMAVDSTHAHLNMPATLMWARGFESRPVRVRFEQPKGRSWRVATQLYPTDDPLTFTAPNFHYLMDSPAEFSSFMLRSFSVAAPGQAGGDKPTFRIALHHDGADSEADAYARDTEKIVRETLAVFGEFPRYETNTYTFLADYLPWAGGDGMEHRNSTVLSSNGALRDAGRRSGLLGTVAHEFFHSWNMERIRARALEPFDFEDADVSGELWFGEGFTSYYDDLLVHRSGLASLEQLLASFGGNINAVMLSPGRRLRSAEEMSRLAPFVDAAVSVDRTSWDNTFISYYTWGATIGLGLDLALRDRSNGKVTLDDYMRAMWAAYGRPGQKEPGKVATPYDMEGLKARLGEVAGGRAFADDFFARHIQGHEMVDYAKLLARAGLLLRPRDAGKAFLTTAQLTFGGGGARVTSPVPFESALYTAGAERDDLLVELDGVSLSSPHALEGILARRKPGDRVALKFVRRSAEPVDTQITLEDNPRVEIVAVEQAGGTLTGEQRQFREGWLRSKVR